MWPCSRVWFTHFYFFPSPTYLLYPLTQTCAPHAPVACLWTPRTHPPCPSLPCSPSHPAEALHSFALPGSACLLPCNLPGPVPHQPLTHPPDTCTPATQPLCCPDLPLCVYLAYIALYLFIGPWMFVVEHPHLCPFCLACSFPQPLGLPQHPCGG